ncbi:Baseplate hub assembly protein, bacteriophage T4-like [uncultured Caudovirales phage]|uniref:Baseplate hub assembly protein, bacteriophage T4-like n=1 Tax=uncultured Caudovirales phage TaxID=2100421 RepID=A0A6J7WTN1_9CAUD|nr:Baseplate hub assembly protein, bacteriophage T4-like [uncultured Caudovirales phage]
MALPKIKHPTYKVVIPSSKQTINLRPFTVQEEKLLLMAKASEKSEDILATVKQIIQNCITEPVDVDKLATFDIEYIFIKLRSKSIGEVVDLEYKENEEDEDTIKFRVNLEDIEVKFNKDHSNKIPVFDDVGIVMRYPTLEEVKILEQSDNEEENIFKILVSCIDTIYDNDEVYSEYTEKELEDFINSLPMESMNKIKTFFETMPAIEHTVKIKNAKGKVKEITLKGINSFFT